MATRSRVPDRVSSDELILEAALAKLGAELLNRLAAPFHESLSAAGRESLPRFLLPLAATSLAPPEVWARHLIGRYNASRHALLGWPVDVVHHALIPSELARKLSTGWVGEWILRHVLKRSGSRPCGLVLLCRFRWILHGPPPSIRPDSNPDHAVRSTHGSRNCHALADSLGCIAWGRSALVARAVAGVHSLTSAWSSFPPVPVKSCRAFQHSGQAIGGALVSGPISQHRLRVRCPSVSATCPCWRYALGALPGGPPVAPVVSLGRCCGRSPP